MDFGAGVGTFAKLLRTRGYRVACVEPDSGQRQTLIENGFTVHASLEALADDGALHIFSLNVLEHIEDDLLTVRQLYKKLRPGGTLLIYVPATDYLWSSLDTRVLHFRRYTRSTLRGLVEQAGFRVQELRYADSLGFFAALVFRWMRRSADALSPSSISFYDRWIFKPSRVLDTFLHPWLGKNVYVIARKERIKGPG